MNDIVSVGATISSIELVELINSAREEGQAILTHADFLKKIPKVLRGAEGNFSSSYKDGSGKQNRCYNLPKREASLMVMSESYTVQAKVYDRMEDLEHRKPEQPRTYEVVMQEALLLADQKVKQLENKILIDKPKVTYAEAVSGSDTSVLVEEWVKSIASHIIIGRNKAFAWLRANRYLRENNLPYQQWIDRGIFECRENLISTAWGQKTNYTTLVTGKGRVYLLEKLIQDHRKNQTELFENSFDS